MFRRAGRLLPARTPVLNPRACFQNFVTSDTMSLMDSQCEKCCQVPRFPEQKVTVIGAGSDVGQIASLFLKQHKVIRTLALYEFVAERGLIGVATDLAHIDTSPEVEAYQGRAFLRAALDGTPITIEAYLQNTDVVLICGGSFAVPPCWNPPDRDLFYQNMHVVRTVVQAVTQFAPHAFVAVQTPPVDCNFSLAMHTLKLARVYNKRRLLGINTITAMRATQLYCAAIGENPCKARVPAVGGACRCTRVPVFSCSNADVCSRIPDESEMSNLTRLVREADDLVYNVKGSNGHAHLSNGFAAARTVYSIITGLFERPMDLDSALVEQDDPEMCYGMKFCATPVTIGRNGIETYKIPKLNEKEKKLLEESKCDLDDMLNLGCCYATGDEYFLHPCKIAPCPPCPPPCPDVSEVVNKEPE